MSGILYIIAAPSGGGKTSLVNSLLQSFPNMRVSISHTTRAKRPGEVDGQHYFFINDEEYQRMLDANEFVEYATVFGYQYGTSKTQLKRLLDEGHDVIFEIDWQGAKQVRTLTDDSISVFILPPSLEALQQRLENRAQDHAETIAQRMDQAQSEMLHYDEFDFVIINDKFEQAEEDLSHIIRCSRLRVAHQRKKHDELLSKLAGTM